MRKEEIDFFPRMFWTLSSLAMFTNPGMQEDEKTYEIKQCGLPSPPFPWCTLRLKRPGLTRWGTLSERTWKHQWFVPLASTKWLGSMDILLDWRWGSCKALSRVFCLESWPPRKETILFDEVRASKRTMISFEHCKPDKYATSLPKKLWSNIWRRRKDLDTPKFRKAVDI